MTKIFYLPEFPKAGRRPLQSGTEDKGELVKNEK